MDKLTSLFTGTPEDPEIKTAKEAIVAAQKAVDDATGDVAKAELKVKVCEAEAALVRLEDAKKNAASPSGGRRKRRGGKHTKKHKKGKSRRLTRARSGRKSSRL